VFTNYPVTLHYFTLQIIYTNNYDSQKKMQMVFKYYNNIIGQVSNGQQPAVT